MASSNCVPSGANAALPCCRARAGATVCVAHWRSPGRKRAVRLEQAPLLGTDSRQVVRAPRQFRSLRFRATLSGSGACPVKERTRRNVVMAQCLALGIFSGCDALNHVVDSIWDRCPPFPCCESDDDCLDGSFCNGVETCAESAGEAGKAGPPFRSYALICPCEPPYCVPGTFPCADDEACDEETDRCLAPCETDADCPGDGRCTIHFCDVAVCASTPFRCDEYLAPP
jgi:hypothetical protein